MKFLKIIILFFLATNVVFAKKNKDACEEFPPKKVVAILIDISEPFDTPNKMSFDKIVERILFEIEPETRLDIYKIAGSSNGVSNPDISLCFPYSKSLMQGDKYWAKKREREFYIPARDVLSRLGESITPGQSSPILESIFTMSLKSFVAKGAANNLPGRVIVISDFMQYSPQISFYQNIPTYSAWRTSVNGRSWVRNFGNVAIEAIVIPRYGSSSLPRAGRDFFISYFDENFNDFQNYKKFVWRDLASSVTPTR
jgi:hypothetical protein